MEKEIELIEKFFRFTDGYNAGNSKVELKRIHTLATARLMQALSDMLGLTERFRFAAFACGVVHDIGRFDQIRKYDSWHDTAALDHGDLGYRILPETDFLDRFDRKEKEMILEAVRYHNKMEIDDSVSGDTLLMCRLMRDADKIDNFRVNANELSDEKVRERVNACVLSRGIFDCMAEHRMTSFALQKNELDEYVGSLSYCYDMNFKESFILAKQQGYFGQLCAHIDPIDEASSRMVKQIISDLADYINGRL